MVNKRDIGKYAESLAVKFLLKEGHKILELNYYSKFGEIDIIAKDKEYIRFIEVKYRKNVFYGYPRETVSLRKQQKIKLTALHYIQANELIDINFSFDVIEVVGTKILFLKNAFW